MTVQTPLSTLSETHRKLAGVMADRAFATLWVRPEGGSLAMVLVFAEWSDRAGAFLPEVVSERADEAEYAPDEADNLEALAVARMEDRGLRGFRCQDFGAAVAAFLATL